MPIRDYDSTKVWISELVHNRPSMTVQNYLWALQVFCDWAEKNPDELISERVEEMTDKSDYLETQTFRRILDFKADGKVKTKYAREMILTALTSFYHDNRAGIGNTDLEETRLKLVVS